MAHRHTRHAALFIAASTVGEEAAGVIMQIPVRRRSLAAWVIEIPIRRREPLVTYSVVMQIPLMVAPAAWVFRIPTGGRSPSGQTIEDLLHATTQVPIMDIRYGEDSDVWVLSIPVGGEAG